MAPQSVTCSAAQYEGMDRFDAKDTPWTHKAGPLLFPVDGVHQEAGYFSSFTIGALLVQVAGADMTGPYAEPSTTGRTTPAV